MNNIEKMSVNAIRILSIDSIQKANSGHPGLPLGAAPMSYELWANHMNHNPKNPDWANRDRFVLSAGHGSAMLYSLLHLFDYGLTIEDLKDFRQEDSLTPGHPEYGHTIGVEATTGPLGAGIGNAVGMAMAEAHLGKKFNKEGFPIVDHYTYTLAGDGCMMEGVSSEALSLAGNLGLDKLIVLYDSNQITIEGSTDLSFTEDVRKRFEAYEFQTLEVEDGNDLEEIANAIKSAKEEKNKPSLIIVKTKIGYGSPLEGSSSAHGAPLGIENIGKTRESLGWSIAEPFEVPEEVYNNYKKISHEKAKIEDQWNTMFDKYCEEYPEMKEMWDLYHGEFDKESLLNDEEFWENDLKADATRNISGKVLNKLAKTIPNLFGGSADLAPSTKSYLDDFEDFSKDNYGGSNIRFGVRENAMVAVGNGILLHGGLRAYVSTFFIFSDFFKPMARLSSLMNLPLIYILTHDSIGVGEDGPTHEPIEQLAMLRAQPNITIFRPADAREVAAGWYTAISSKDSPTALILTRQNLNPLKGSSKEAIKGGYIISDSKNDLPEGILIASGSEVDLAIKAQENLSKEGIDVRVVSMPSMELFEKQTKEYKDSILPNNVRKRLAIEAASSLGWGKYVGLDGATLTMDTFGASAPGDVLFKKFGFTVDNLVKKYKNI